MLCSTRGTGTTGAQKKWNQTWRSRTDQDKSYTPSNTNQLKATIY